LSFWKYKSCAKSIFCKSTALQLDVAKCRGVQKDPSMTHKKTTTATIRLATSLQDRLHRLKLQRAASSGLWPSNQELLVEALELLLADIPTETADTDKTQLQLF